MMGEPRRVLAISSHAGLGGSELTFLRFLEHRPETIDVDVLLVGDGPLRGRLEQQRFTPRVAHGCEGKPNLRMVIAFHRQLASVLDDGRFDVVWAMGQKAALLAALTCRLRRVPLVWHKVDFSWDRLLAIPLAIASKGVIAVSEAVAATLGPLRRRCVGIVGPPTDLPRELEPVSSGGPPAIGTLARLVPYKGHHLIIEAGSVLRDEFPSLRVILAGEPHPKYADYPDELRRAAARAGIADRLELLGFSPPAEVLERLTVFVNATFRDAEGFGFEGLSGAMLEASWGGLPVVATSGGGTAEGLIEDQTGTLVDGADPAALAAAIRPYLRDPDRARRVGAAGRRYVRSRFAPEIVAAELWNALEAASSARSR